jgi:uncharacterized OB-fold protein
MVGWKMGKKLVRRFNHCGHTFVPPKIDLITANYANAQIDLSDF